MTRSLGLLLPCLLAACGGESAVHGERHPVFRAFALRFGQAVRAGDYAAAYAMTSPRHYRGSTDLTAFRALLGQARDEYGEAAHVDMGVNTLEADGPLGEGLDFPEDVAVKDRRARLVIHMQAEPDETVYEIWINVVAEGGDHRIVTVQIPGINF